MNTQIKIGLGCVIVAASAGAFVLRGRGRVDESGRTPVAATPAPSAVESASGRLLRYSERSEGSIGRPIVLTTDFVAGLRYEQDDTQVDLVYKEFVPATANKIAQVEYGFGTSFLIRSTGVRGTDNLFVAGVARTGEDVIESWYPLEPKGSYYFHFASGSPIGTPSSALPTYTTGLVGNSYIPVDQRPKRLRETRKELFRGNLGGGILALVADPEGRYLLCMTSQPRALYQLQLGGSGHVPVLMHDAAAVPALGQAPVGSYLAQHGTLGRTAVFEFRPIGTNDVGVDHVLVNDSNNDGAFDGVSTFTPQQWQSGGFEGNVWDKANFYKYTP